MWGINTQESPSMKSVLMGEWVGERGIDILKNGSLADPQWFSGSKTVIKVSKDDVLRTSGDVWITMKFWGCEDSSVVEHQLCILWNLGSTPGWFPEGTLIIFLNRKALWEFRWVEVDAYSLDHILSGEVGNSCNSCNGEHNLLLDTIDCPRRYGRPKGLEKGGPDHIPFHGQHQRQKTQRAQEMGHHHD